MKWFIGLLILSGVEGWFVGVQQPKGTVHIQVSNIRGTKGDVLISLYDNAKDFPKNAPKAVGRGKAEIKNGVASITFTNLPPGNYAAAILHDENNNRKMDFNLVGMPKEGYGFSNNAKGTLGPPSFKEASFSFDGGEKKIVIKATYFL
jgi:uncharacterized protein (DUF2141 family)